MIMRLLLFLIICIAGFIISVNAQTVTFQEGVSGYNRCNDSWVFDALADNNYDGGGILKLQAFEDS